jgi:hypothetical protein
MNMPRIVMNSFCDAGLKQLSINKLKIRYVNSKSMGRL